MEPMITGSPPSPISDRMHNSQLFLPSYLLGQSETPGGGARSHVGDAGGTPSSSKFGHRVTWSPELNHTSYYQATSPTPPQHHSSYRGGSNAIGQNSSANRDAFGGPPVRGLASEQFASDGAGGASGDFRQFSNNSFNQSGAAAVNFSTNGQQPNMMTSSDFSNVDNGFDYDENSDELRSCCVTVFGFPPGYLQYILQHFSQYGTVLNYETPNKCNWIHVRYQTKLQAAKALSKNGKIFNDCVQIGVVPCTDQQVIRRLSRINENVLQQHQGTSNRSPIQTNIPFANGVKTTDLCSTSDLTHDGSASNLQQPQATRSNMRPLASYAAGSNNISDNWNLIGKSDGLLAKARQYVLGW